MEAASELVIAHGVEGVDAAGAEEIESADPVRTPELQHWRDRPRRESDIVGPHDLVRVRHNLLLPILSLVGDWSARPTTPCWELGTDRLCRPVPVAVAVL